MLLSIYLFVCFFLLFFCFPISKHPFKEIDFLLFRKKKIKIKQHSAIRHFMFPFFRSNYYKYIVYRGVEDIYLLYYFILSCLFFTLLQFFVIESHEYKQELYFITLYRYLWQWFISLHLSFSSLSSLSSHQST